MSKFDIQPQFKSQNRILNVKAIFGHNSNTKMDFECKNATFGPILKSKSVKKKYKNRISNVKI